MDTMSDLRHMNKSIEKLLVWCGDVCLVYLDYVTGVTGCVRPCVCTTSAGHMLVVAVLKSNISTKPSTGNKDSYHAPSYPPVRTPDIFVPPFPVLPIFVFFVAT